MSENKALWRLPWLMESLPHRLMQALLMGLVFCLMAFSASASVTSLDCDAVVVWWAFDGGNLTDNQSGHTCTPVNAPTSVPGILGDAYDFEEDDGEYLNCGDQDNYSFGTNEFAITFWAKPETVDSSQYLFSKSTATREYLIYYGGTPKLQSYLGTAAANLGEISGQGVANGVWTLNTITSEGGTASGNQHHWYNDVFNESAPDDNGIYAGMANTASDLYISAYSNPSNYYDGILDEIVIWNVNLTQDNITALYNGGVGVRYDEVCSPAAPPPAANVTGLSVRAKSEYQNLFIDNINITVTNRTDSSYVTTDNSSTFFDGVRIGFYEVNITDPQWPNTTYNLTLGPITRPDEDNDIISLLRFNNNPWYGETSSSVYDFATHEYAYLSVPYGAGYYGDGGLAFHNSTCEYVNITNHSQPNAGTMMFWFYLNVDDEVMRFTSYGTPGGDTTFRYNNLNKLRLAIRADVDDCVATSGANINKETWYHAAATWNGSDCAIYVDGSEDGTDTYSGTVYDNDTLIIGTSTTGINCLNGSMDEFVRYNRSLSAAEVLAYYNSHLLSGGVNENNFTGNLTQSTFSLNASEVVTRAVLTHFNLTFSNLTFNSTNGTLTFPIEGGTHQVGLTSLGWWDESLPLTFGNLTHTTYEFNVTRFVLNISAVSLATGNPITDFTVVINHSGEYSYLEENVTTDGLASFYVINGTYNVSISSVDFAPTYAMVTFNETSGPFIHYNFTMFVANTFNITFLDEITGLLIDSGNSFLDIISDPYAGSYNTSNGTLRIPLLTPSSYVFRYRSEPDYPERFYYFNLSNGTFNNIPLYLLNSSSVSNVTITVIDENALPVEGAVVNSLRYDITTNSYISQEKMITNFAGEGVMSLELNTEYYQFIISYNNEVKKTTNPAYVTETSQTFQINIGVTVGEVFSNYLAVDYALDFNNDTDNFVFTYSDADGLVSGGCLHIYRTSLEEEVLVNSSCPITSSAVVVLGVEPVNGTTYRADGYVILDGTLTYLLSRKKTYAPTGNFQDEADNVFLLILMTILFCFLGRIHIVLPLLFAPLPTVIWSLLGWVPVQPWAAFILYAICAIVAVLIMRRS